MRVFIIAATLLAGALIPVQTAINSQLRVALFQSPVLTSLVSFAVGITALALVLDHFGLIGLPIRGDLPLRLTGALLVLLGAFVFTRG